MADPRIYGSHNEQGVRLDATSPFRQKMEDIWNHGGPLQRYDAYVQDLRSQFAMADVLPDRHVLLATHQIDDRIQNHLPKIYIQQNMAELLVYLAVYQRERFEHLVAHATPPEPPEIQALHELQRVLGMRD